VKTRRHHRRVASGGFGEASVCLQHPGGWPKLLVRRGWLPAGVFVHHRYRLECLQQLTEVVAGAKRARMPTSERLVPPLERLAYQRLGGGEVSLGLEQQAKVVDGGECVWMPITQRPTPLQAATRAPAR